MRKKKKDAGPKNRQKLTSNFKDRSVAAFNLAYGLYTSPSESQAASTAKKLIVLKKKELPGEAMPQGLGTMNKIKKLSMDASEQLESLAFVLLKATEDESLKEKVLSLLLQGFSDDLCQCMMQSVIIDRKARAELGDTAAVYGREGSCEAFGDFIESGKAGTKEFLFDMASAWAGIKEYLDLFDVKEFLSEHEEVFSKLGRVIKNDDLDTLLLTTIDAIGAIAKVTGEPDSLVVDSYKNDSPFFTEAVETAQDMFAAFGSPCLSIYNRKLEYDHVFGVWEVGATISRRNQLKMREAATKVLAAPDEKSVQTAGAALEDRLSPFGVWLSHAANELRCIYMLCGVDLLAISGRTRISSKEGRRIVKKAFVFYEIIYRSENGKNAVCAYEKESERRKIAELIAVFWAQHLMSERLDVLVDEKRLLKGRNENKELAEAKGLIRRLKEENELLRSQSEDIGIVDEEELKAKTAEVKGLRTELHSMEAALKREEERSASLEAEIKDLKQIIELEMDDEEGADALADDTGVSDEFFSEYIKNNKVLIWGLRESTEQKYAELYPELYFASSARKLTRRQLENYDVLIICTSNCNHSNYWATRDTAKAYGIKVAHLTKSMNAPMHLWKALGDALGGMAS